MRPRDERPVAEPPSVEMLFYGAVACGLLVLLVGVLLGVPVWWWFR